MPPVSVRTLVIAGMLGVPAALAAVGSPRSSTAQSRCCGRRSLTPPAGTNLRQLMPEGYIKPSVFREVFAADLPQSTTDVMAASQRPAAVAALGEPSGVPAWRTIPSWYLVAGADHAIGTELERFMAERMEATTVEVESASHVVMISRPERTTRLILGAAGRR